MKNINVLTVIYSFNTAIPYMIIRILGHVIINNNKTYLYYYVVYEQDGGKQILCYSIDSHPMDIEGVIIELDETNAISGICYQPHGSKEHFWIRNKADITKICTNNRPNVYMSVSKHASYPLPGKIWRIYGFGNDNCDPVECKYTIVTLNDTLLHRQVYGAMVGFPSRFAQDLSKTPEIRLSKLKFKSFLYKFW